ncbi:hypothetical protein O9929_22295 [Vibrio lentus]|nr:hypothetical protein [Vibrio lentus]
MLFEHSPCTFRTGLLRDNTFGVPSTVLLLFMRLQEALDNLSIKRALIAVLSG